MKQSGSQMGDTQTPPMAETAAWEHVAECRNYDKSFIFWSIHLLCEWNITIFAHGFKTQENSVSPIWLICSVFLFVSWFWSYRCYCRSPISSHLSPIWLLHYLNYFSKFISLCFRNTSGPPVRSQTRPYSTHRSIPFVWRFTCAIQGYVTAVGVMFQPRQLSLGMK